MICIFTNDYSEPLPVLPFSVRMQKYMFKNTGKTAQLKRLVYINEILV